jgi:hypothetical protein
MKLIVPIYGLRYYTFIMPKLNDMVILIKEKDNAYDSFAIAAYNQKGEKFGYVSAVTGTNLKIYDRMNADIIFGKAWSIRPNQILVELTFHKTPLQKMKSAKNQQKPPSTSPLF